jgi:hypothetical protein
MITFIGEAYIEMRARKVIDDVDTFDKLPEMIRICNIAANRLQTGMPCLMPQQVQVEIDRTNVIPARQLTIHQVTSNESAGASDQDSHD